MRIKLIIVLIILCFDFNAQVNDVEGRTYKTVQIGSQTWMAENLNVSKFRNGDLILEAKNELEWQEAAKNKQPAWCYYENDTANGSKYGKLYNWYAVGDPRGLAPEGFRIPMDVEWKVLTDYLGDDAEQKLKVPPIYETKAIYREEGGYYETKWVACSNCSYWTEKQKAYNPCTMCKNTGGKLIKTGKYIPKINTKIGEQKNQVGGWNGTNESEFSSLPGGFLYEDGSFGGIGNDGWWWSLSEHQHSYTLQWSQAWAFYISDYKNYGVFMIYLNKGRGFSVRCIKDSENIPSDELFEPLPPDEFDPPTPKITDYESFETFIEESSDFPGGPEKMIKFINDNIDYPQEAIDLGIKGRVTVRFVVEKDGRLSNVSVATPLAGCKACDDAAVKLVEKMPPWEPGKNGGRPVRSWVTLPIKFDLE